ncbi:hypothetical protein O7623_18910 [Solwaraspora sp. WMMD791]|uniref:hypothetical protein n=1 Tax=Solwaraspora sp. WMMD791 TaxID=3016086 RepID=UPI002499DEE7|nr:hypothetical protein [Solwaraspora sp. WMMD791]WFE25457.1 hypothetical protein O7623_18910 [Solwaraspora sp. WMMD791]
MIEPWPPRYSTEHDPAVTYETSAALLCRDDAHAFRLVLVALGEAEGDHADEIMAAVFHVDGHEASLRETLPSSHPDAGSS